MANLANTVPVPAPVLTNDAARGLLLGTATRRSQRIATQFYTPGSPMIFLMPNIPLPYLVRMFIGGTVTASTAAADTGYRWPSALFQRLTLTDYLGTQRIAVRPYHLERLIHYKRVGLRSPFNGQASIEPNASSVLGTAGLVNTPGPGTASAFAVGSTNVAWYWDIPISYSPTDLRGIFRCDVAGSQTTIQLDPATTPSSTTAGNDVPITLHGSGTVSLSALQVWFEVYYYDPVVVQVPDSQGNLQSIVPYPLGDMSVVHELLSLDVTAGLTNGVEQLYQLPTGREYYAMLEIFNNATTVGWTQNLVTRLRFLIEGSNNVGLDEYQQDYLSRTLEQFNGLPGDTEIWWNWRDRPWDSNRYGQLQLGTTFNSSGTINAGARLEFMRETMYQVAQVAA